MDESVAGTIRVSGEALCEATGVSRRALTRMVRLAVLEPVSPGADEYPADAVRRLRRLLRLHRDLGVNLVGAAILVDLLDRMEALERELDRLRRERR
jgi:hypothetical protein